MFTQLLSNISHDKQDFVIPQIGYKARESFAQTLTLIFVKLRTGSWVEPRHQSYCLDCEEIRNTFARILVWRMLNKTVN